MPKHSLKLSGIHVVQMIAGEVEAPRTVSQLQQPDELSEELPIPLPQSSIIAKDNSEEQLNCNIEKKEDGMDSTLLKEKRFSPQWNQAGSMEQSIQSVLASGPECRMKRCRLCQRNTVKQLGTIEEMQFCNVARNVNRFTDMQHQQNRESDLCLWNSKLRTEPLLSNKTDESESQKGRQTVLGSDASDVEYEDFSSDKIINSIGKRRNDEVDCLSKEASKAVEQIELCISALHLGVDHLNQSEESRNCVQEINSAGPALQTECGALPTVGVSQGEKSFMARDNLQFQRVEDSIRYLLHQVPSLTAEKINLPYLSLSPTSKPVRPTKTMWRQSTSSLSRGRGLALRNHVSGQLEESIGQGKFPPKKMNEIHDQNAKGITDKIGSRNWISTCDYFVPVPVHNVQNMSVALDPNETSCIAPRWPTTFSSASEMERPYQIHMAVEEAGGRRKLFQTYKPSDSYMNLNNSENIGFLDSRLNVTSTYHPPKIIGDSLLEMKPCQLLLRPGFHENHSDGQCMDGIPENKHKMTAARKSLHHQESEGTESYSSDWRSQQTRSRDSGSESNSDSEEYSLPDETRELQYVNSSMNTESGVSPVSYGTGSQSTSHTSNTDNEFYSSTSGDEAPEATSSSSSKSKGYPSCGQPICRHAGPKYLPGHSTLKKSGRGRIHISANGINHKKESGKWKRLKDKLAIIFHHHHHHHQHHHHHHDDEDDHGNDQMKMSDNTSLQKHKGKIINFKRKHEAYGERAIEKTRRSLIHDKNQQGNFHGLMEGLLRHVRHSKKSKQGKETVGPVAKGQHNMRKKTLKKSHWWQLLQHHRGAHLPNKTHLKLELDRTKKALPKLK
ncbi:UNVERIFIED_CONTAM: hypothetical protein Sindi_2563200 [Sesamum indicum]